MMTCHEIAEGIARFLATQLGADGNFAGGSFYGEAFAALVWSRLGDEFAAKGDAALSASLGARPEKIQNHWEFHNYALLRLARQQSGGLARESGKREMLQTIRPLRFRGRRTANWTLLRALSRLLAGERIALARLEVLSALLRFRRRGFLADARTARSFQYHCYCGALLAEIHELTGWKEAGRAWLDAAEWIAPFIMPNGASLYVGRGQEQIFGYGALIFLLSRAARATADSNWRDLAQKVMSRLESFRREDGSFPLVLNEFELRDPSLRHGWYSYNNLYDYLPFLAWYLLLASQAQVEETGPADLVPQEMALLGQRPGFLVHQGRSYTAVVSRPWGQMSNALPFPLVCCEEAMLFPCYGGEGAERSGRADALPLPFGVRESGRALCLWRDCRYTLNGNLLEGAGADLIHSRSFRFDDACFSVEDTILMKRRTRLREFYPLNLLLVNGRQLSEVQFETGSGQRRARIFTDHPCRVVADTGLSCALGPLIALRECAGRADFRRGDIVRRSIRVELAE
jgi:hypothetical protein